jgi:arabinan endo-1,5-alpha-L-arabinosidase
MKITAKYIISLSVAAAAVAVGQTPAPSSNALSPTDIARKFGMRNIRVHDPSTIVKCGDEYYISATGAPMFHSKDLTTWTAGVGPTVGLTMAWPAEARSSRGAGSRGNPAGAPPAATNSAAGAGASARGGRGGGGGGGDFWAPDIIKVKDKYFVFLSTSSFGVNNSAIGVISSPTLNPADPAYKWTDGGLIVKSDTLDDFNCIDPAALCDTDGRLWLCFGSFWGGIRLIELNPDTGRRIAPNSPMYHIAHFDSIEASYIYKHDNYYYLFVNWGMCCRGANSTYNMRIGRSESITGPYLDKEGKDIATGGGTSFMNIVEGPLVGFGHAGIIQVGDKYFISSHVESNASGAAPENAGTLSIRPLTWDAQGWPVAGQWD